MPRLKGAVAGVLCEQRFKSLSRIAGMAELWVKKSKNAAKCRAQDRSNDSHRAQLTHINAFSD